MSISCSCGYLDGAAWFYYPPGMQVTLSGPRAKRCKSCKKRLPPGGQCRQYARFRNPKNLIEENIHGNEVPLAHWYLCPECAAIHDALSDAQVCADLDSNLLEDLMEFNATYAPIPGFCLKVQRV